MAALLAAGQCFAAEPSAQRVEESSSGRITVTVTADQQKVSLDREIRLNIRIRAPSEIDTAIPSIQDRLQGFTVKASIDGEPVTASGTTTRENRYLLTPVISEEYRLAPLAVTFTDKSKSPPESGWFATKPMVFELVPPVSGKIPDRISATITPVWIYPSFPEIARWVGLVILLAALAIFIWKVSGRVKKQIQLMRMSPKERALHELSELLAKDLIGRQLVKEFYLELTMVVRRYIERQHKIRAPEQTTQEFMEAVGKDQRFSRDVISKLRSFLEAADLVKFAAYQPAPDAISRATGTARDYIVTDAGLKEQQKTQGGQG